MAEKSTEDQWYGVGNNQLRLVLSAPDRMKALVSLIDDAKQSIKIFYYMFEEDTVGRTIRDRLVAACERGVAVELIVDSFGSNGASAGFFDPLKAAGSKFAVFSPRFSTSYFVRNHQKMIIADNNIALIGGFNIADQYFYRHDDDEHIEENLTSWEDLGLLLKGPEVGTLVDYYAQLSDWVYNSNGQLRSLRTLVKRWNTGDGQFRWLLGGPSNRLSRWAYSIKQDLEHGRDLCLVTAYFSPGQGLLRRIGRLSKRGGSSRLLLAGKTDNAATIGASRLLYGYLLRRKAQIFEYQPKLLHMKLVIIDDAVYIGSANFDLRSLFINVEMMLRIEDRAFADHTRQMVDGLLEKAEPITPKIHKARKTILTRLRWIISYFVVNAIDYSVTRKVNFGLNKKANMLPSDK